MRVLTTILTAMIFGGFAGVEYGADEAAGRRQWNFQADAVGHPPSGFRSAVGAWTVVDDGGNHVLAQTARNEDAVFNVIIRTDALYADVDVSVRLKAVKGFVDQGGGIIWREECEELLSHALQPAGGFVPRLQGARRQAFTACQRQGARRHELAHAARDDERQHDS